MTPEDAIIAIKLLKPDIEWDLSLEYQEALDEAIEALSKQSASSEQVDKSVIVDFVAFQREWLNSHKTLELDAVNNALVNIFLKTTGKAFIDSLGQSAENDEDRTRDDEGPKLFGKRTIIEPGEEFIAEDLLKEALDQSADSDKMIKLEKRTITERLIIAESLINSVIADSNQFREATKKTDFKPGDKFILELGAERKMFGEFEIAGTDLYVKTDLLDKLTRYEPETKEVRQIMRYRDRVKLAKNFEEWAIKNNVAHNAEAVVGYLDLIGLIKQPEKMPYKKPEIIHCGDCRWYKKSHYCGANYPAPDDFCSWAERRNDG